MLGLPNWEDPKLRAASQIHYCIDEYTLLSIFNM